VTTRVFVSMSTTVEMPTVRERVHVHGHMAGGRTSTIHV